MAYPLLVNQMPERIKKVWQRTLVVTSCISLIVLIGISIAAYYFEWWNQYWTIVMSSLFGVVIVATISSGWLLPYRYLYYRYELTNDEMLFQKGYFFRSTTIVPIVRIQHIETEQGPFLRKEKLMEIVVHTAATTHRIAGLDIEEAQQLRAEIMRQVRLREYE
uniref:PH domain-containing protein n=1 Tax=Candidatus Enterococcus willemsii TaxID=1857215 RepID=UPI00403F8FD3